MQSQRAGEWQSPDFQLGRLALELSLLTGVASCLLRRMLTGWGAGERPFLPGVMRCDGREGKLRQNLFRKNLALFPSASDWWGFSLSSLAPSANPDSRLSQLEVETTGTGSLPSIDR